MKENVGPSFGDEGGADGQPPSNVTREVLAFNQADALQLLGTINEISPKSFLDLDHRSYPLLLKSDRETTALRLLGDAFSYVVSVNWSSSRYQTTLEPAVNGIQVWPEALGNVGDAVLQTWRYLYKHLEISAARARLADLIYTVGKLPKQEWSLAVVDTSIEAFKESTWAMRDRYELAIRSLDLARKHGMRDRHEELIRLIEDELLTVFKQENWFSLSLINLLRAYKLTARNSQNHASQQEQIYTTFKEISQQTIISDFTFDAMLPIMDPGADTQEFQRRHILGQMDLASASDSKFQKKQLYGDAAKLARKYQFQDLHKEAIRALQKVPNDLDEWHRVTQGVSIPTGVIERETRKYTRYADWQTCIHAVLSDSAPTGDYSKNLKRAEEMVKKYPLRHLFTNIAVGVHGLPEKTRNSQDEAITADLKSVELMAAQVSAGITHSALMRIHQRFPSLNGECVALFLQREYATEPSLAAAFGRALACLWEGEYEEASLKALFRIEGAARQLLIMLDEPLYRMEAGEGRGKFPSLDFYVDSLEKQGMDLDWVRSIRTILLADGWNLRNLVAHGFEAELGPTQAVLLLRLLGMFCLITVVGDDHLPSQLFAAQKMSRREELATIRATRKVLQGRRRRRGKRS